MKKNKQHTLIIAEAGVNHNGDMSKALQLIDAAAEAGVDIVKFQTFKADTLVSPKAKKANYQQDSLPDDDQSQYKMLKKLELSDDDHNELIEHCSKKGLQFFSTAFDTEGLKYLNSLGFEQFKVPSGEITNYPYLRELASFGKPVIISTGMSSMDDIEAALNVLTQAGMSKSDITVLHCNTQYPTPMEDVNLLAMNHIKDTFDVNVGYSDHTMGIEVPIAAVALGATVIEKHFTLDRGLPGPDHSASLEPHELKQMVQGIRNIELAISGTGKKAVSKSESQNIIPARKSIHVRRQLQAGEVIKEEDLIPLRPAVGMSPMEWENVVGKKVVDTIEAFEPLHESNLAE
ncbi:N-acetylneuraminate synthase [Phaeocystidibacter luteus]|uniref:N-acetylneuraminate synthase n=1 Tax=Phaeocystidibacter luteus TaxID=911197 RepID=A0A6N6RLB7_9FLAO|nr:N-acetylneuraminate synthase [Phaeocystidibacter luteus]KAB2814319.1 N-acetylneuraminate synthase [Phaeocystidibacter luteus]